jgi:hypothetical protein
MGGEKSEIDPHVLQFLKAIKQLSPCCRPVLDDNRRNAIIGLLYDP